MCGLVGMEVSSGHSLDRGLLSRMMEQALYRGQRATGWAWLTADGRLECKILEGPHPEVPEELPEDARAVIGHARYSTSGEVHQPLLQDLRASGGDWKALVLNGVIDQRPPSEWPGGPYLTDCDAEIVLRRPGAHGGSYAVLELVAPRGGLPGYIRGYRNGLRPLYFTTLRGVHLWASTRDMLHRAGVHNRYVEVNQRGLHANLQAWRLPWSENLRCAIPT